MRWNPIPCVNMSRCAGPAAGRGISVGHEAQLFAGVLPAITAQRARPRVVIHAHTARAHPPPAADKYVDSKSGTHLLRWRSGCTNPRVLPITFAANAFAHVRANRIPASF